MALRQTDKASLRIFERNPLHPELPTEFALAWPQQCAAQNREEYVKIARIEAQ
jgi:hypothetical protein